MTTPQQELYNSACAGNIQGIRKALEHGADINAPYTDQPGQRRSMTPLQVAASYGRAKAFELLLQLGADLQARGEEPSSCLRIALTSVGDHDEVGRLCVLAGDDIHEPTATGQTMLHRACRRNLQRTAEALLAHGADPGARDSRGRTPMHDAVYANPLAILALHEAGGEVDALDNRECRPLHEAVAHGLKATAHTLRALNASYASVFSPDRETNAHIALSPVANAVLTLEPRVVLRCLDLKLGYDLAQVQRELSRLDPTRVAPMQDLLRSCHARHEADKALADNALPCRPGAAP